jgi:hypothetical protein
MTTDVNGPTIDTLGILPKRAKGLDKPLAG